MSNILVSGLINIETTLQCDEFPIEYSPVRYPFFGIQNTISGVGYNVAKALTLLSDNVQFMSIIGKNKEGEWITDELQSLHIDTQYITPSIAQTPIGGLLSSLILTVFLVPMVYYVVDTIKERMNKKSKKIAE